MAQQHRYPSGAADMAAGSSLHRFMGVDLLLSPGVLVPRGETELLGHTAVERLVGMGGAPKVVDMCCGSGNLAVGIAHHCPAVRLWAADLTDDSVALARKNVLRHALSARISIRKGDLFGALEGDSLKGEVDMVVCNPPYISSSRLENESAHLLENEPRTAFDGGPYGISILQRVAKEAAFYLKPGGWLLFEFGAGQERLVASLLARTGDYGEPGFAMLDGRPRVAIVRRNGTETTAGARH